MDKKLLALFRKQFALDMQTLPDTISPEDFGKLIEKSSGKLFVKPEDLKNLQKSLSQKDLELKKLQAEAKEKKKKIDVTKTDAEKMLESMNSTITNLEATIKQMNTAQQTEKLKVQYPDILPEFLIGKSDEEIEAIVDKQREVNKKLYGDSTRFAPPDYSSEAQIDEEIKNIENNKAISGENSAVSVLKLGRAKTALSNE